jgi:secreted trypsin-like serine protease
MLIIKTITCSIIQGIFLALSIAHARAAGNETDKIVGGSPASSGEYLGYAIPSIQSGSRFLCGAYLIRNNILVTAAHCREAFEGFDVYIGGLQRLGEDAVETIATGDVCQHPGYSEKGLFSSPFANDIMLIRLQTPSNQPIKEYYTVSHHYLKRILRRHEKSNLIAHRFLFSVVWALVGRYVLLFISLPVLRSPAFPSGLV